MKLHFYKCTAPDRHKGYKFYDHGKGIIGFENKRKIDNKYLGKMTIDELDQKLIEPKGLATRRYW